MEERVFRRPAVAGELRRMVEARLHNDGPDRQYRNEIKELQRRLGGTLATPTYVLVDPRSERVLGVHVGPQFDPELFSAWLRERREEGGFATALGAGSTASPSPPRGPY